MWRECDSATRSYQTHLARKAEREPLKLSSWSLRAPPWHRRHVLQLRDAEIVACTRIMRPHELGYAWCYLRSEACTVKDTIMPDLRAFEVTSSLVRHANAQIVRGTALASTSDVVPLALDGHKRRALDRAEIDLTAAMGHKPARH